MGEATFSEGRSDEYFLYEDYLVDVGGARPRGLLTPYYAIKPLLPRTVQLRLRRLYARHQAQRSFPAWPIEPILLNRHYEALRRRIEASPIGRIPVTYYWPGGKRFAYIVTHDVEGLAGIENIPRLLEVESRHGVVSSWNFVAEEYPIPGDLFDELRAQGHEIGLHGIRHDRSLFRSRRLFERQLPLVHRYLREWAAVGFRSPATFRNARWMPELGCLYDSSFPDTDPFEPQPGGCCSIFPYLIDGMVELPITLVQDHTLLEILGRRSTDLWVEKARWLIEHHGLVTLIVHPDYLLADERLELYDRFLRWLSSQPGGWHAVPADVARWWKRRAELEGPDAYARVAGDRVVFDLDDPQRSEGQGHVGVPT